MATGQSLIKRRDRLEQMINNPPFALGAEEREYYTDLYEKVKMQIEEEGVCHVCGRPLTSEQSKRDGFGPECKAKFEAHKNGQIVPFLVGITGYATSGKDTLAAGLIEQLGFKKLAFADALRRDLTVLDPIVAINEETGGFIRLHHCMADYNAAKARYPEFRRLLQVYGTEVHRALDDDYWINRAAASIVADGTTGYVFTDMRFPNERSGLGYDLTIRVERPGVGPLNDHASERYIGEMPVDIEILNDGTPEHLENEGVEVVRTAMEAKLG
jgi:hypothetical protein